MNRRRFRLATLYVALVAVALAATAAIASPARGATRQPVPHGSGGGHAAPQGTATRGGAPPHGTAHGNAHYGYGYGGNTGGYWGGGYYPYWGGYWGSPYWGIGWSVSWGWPYYGPYYGGYYGPYYGANYVYGGEHFGPSGPAVIETGITPKKSEVLLDGKAIGNAKDFNGRWDDLRIEPGRHTVTFRYPGYRSLTFEIDAQPGAHYVLHDTLAEGAGEDRRVIAAPESRAGEPAARPEQVTPPAHGTAGLAKGLLRVRVTPEDAGVYLDGEFLGMGTELARLHGAIPVATGGHKLEIVRPGYTSDVRTVEVDGDATAEVEVILTKTR